MICVLIYVSIKYNRSKHSDNNGGYLNTLFSPSVLPDEKKNVLSKKYNIAMIAELGNHGDRNGGHLIGYGGLISVPVAQ